MQHHTDGIPPDGTTVTVISVFHIAAVSVMYTFGAGGIVFCIICLIFNIVFRKKRYLKYYDNFRRRVMFMNNNNNNSMIIIINVNIALLNNNYFFLPLFQDCPLN